jgi:hypothetical protein
MNISPYTATIQEAFNLAVSDLPDDHTKLVDDIVDKIGEQVLEKVRDNARNYLLENISDDIQRAAATVAESMLMNAMAGDKKELRNLFGFSDWYMNYLYLGDYPREYQLLDMLIERNPDIFINEKIAQLTAANEHYKKEINRLRDYIAKLKEAEAN